MIILRTREPDEELEQRILQLLEREKTPAERLCLPTRAKLRFGSLVIDGTSGQAFAGGASLALTKTEFSLLLFLSQNPGTALSKEELLRAVWGSDCADTPKVVANNISNLRKKLGPAHRNLIQTVPGGYVFGAS